MRHTHIEQGFFDVLTASANGLPIRTHRRCVVNAVLIKLGPIAAGCRPQILAVWLCVNRQSSPLVPVGLTRLKEG